MGYYFATGECVACGGLFTFNPDLVPSVVIAGERQPVCRDCIERANSIRRHRGLAELPILRGAYDPTEEGAL